MKENYQHMHRQQQMKENYQHMHKENYQHMHRLQQMKENYQHMHRQQQMKRKPGLEAYCVLCRLVRERISSAPVACRRLTCCAEAELHEFLSDDSVCVSDCMMCVLSV